MDLRRALSGCDGYLFPGQDGESLGWPMSRSDSHGHSPAGWTGHILRFTGRPCTPALVVSGRGPISAMRGRDDAALRAGRRPRGAVRLPNRQVRHGSSPPVSASARRGAGPQGSPARPAAQDPQAAPAARKDVFAAVSWTRRARARKPENEITEAPPPSFGGGGARYSGPGLPRRSATWSASVSRPFHRRVCVDFTARQPARRILRHALVVYLLGDLGLAIGPRGLRARRRRGPGPRSRRAARHGRPARLRNSWAAAPTAGPVLQARSSRLPVQIVPDSSLWICSGSLHGGLRQRGEASLSASTCDERSSGARRRA